MCWTPGSRFVSPPVSSVDSRGHCSASGGAWSGRYQTTSCTATSPAASRQKTPACRCSPARSRAVSACCMVSKSHRRHRDRLAAGTVVAASRPALKVHKIHALAARYLWYRARVRISSSDQVCVWCADIIKGQYARSRSSEGQRYARRVGMRQRREPGPAHWEARAGQRAAYRVSRPREWRP